MEKTCISLANGHKMPLMAFGTWQATGDKLRTAIREAIKCGYRHIDTAYMYQNEAEIGNTLKELIAEGAVKREGLFITTKLWGTFNRPERVERGFMLSLKALQLDYVDLFLMHLPTAMKYVDDSTLLPPAEDGSPGLALDDVNYIDTWKAMESLVEKGVVKSIGVSNFNVKQLGEVLKVAKVPCVNIQIENHPFLNQSELTKFCKVNNVSVTSYGPLGSPERPWATENELSFLVDPTVKFIAGSHQWTAAQVLVAYHLSQGIACTAKSTSVERLQENFKSLEVKLTEDEIKKLDALDRNLRRFTWDAVKKHEHFPF